MAQKSKIEWTEATWNPITGCTKISEGCQNCYAEKMSMRLKSIGVEKYIKGFNLALHPDALEEPLKWKKSKVIFVCSMSDLFHEDVPDDFIIKVFKIMNEAEQHVFQVLTKRSSRLIDINNKVNWTNNIWLGVTVESELHIDRIIDLKQTNAHIKFLSLEPLLSEIPRIPLDGINWVIVGGESGFIPRPIHPEWVRDIQKQCFDNNVPFFFKQWGGKNKKKAGNKLDGKTWMQMPISFTSQIS